MTRESKIGMLTGLFVIILIGVLLSEYLGDAAGPAGAGSPTGRMAPLPAGEGYRREVMRPIGVPGMERGTGEAALVGGTEIQTRHGMLAFAAEGTNDNPEPRMAPPVNPEPAGATPEAAPVNNPPVIHEPKPAAPAPVIVKLPVKEPANVTHEIAAGDTLGKIAKKYYNSSKNSDVQRIVAANPGLLKDATTMLVVKKKLVIPGVVAQAVVAERLAEEKSGTVVPIPGDVKKPVVEAKQEKTGTGTPIAKGGEATAKKETVYAVQAGDTLAKIAKKYAPEKSGEMVQKLMAANGLKKPEELKAGAKLKIPTL